MSSRIFCFFWSSVREGSFACLGSFGLRSSRLAIQYFLTLTFFFFFAAIYLPLYSSYGFFRPACFHANSTLAGSFALSRINLPRAVISLDLKGLCEVPEAVPLLPAAPPPMDCLTM